MGQERYRSGQTSWSSLHLHAKPHTMVDKQMGGERWCSDNTIQLQLPWTLRARGHFAVTSKGICPHHAICTAQQRVPHFQVDLCGHSWRCVTSTQRAALPWWWIRARVNTPSLVHEDTTNTNMKVFLGIVIDTHCNCSVVKALCCWTQGRRFDSWPWLLLF